MVAKFSAEDLRKNDQSEVTKRIETLIKTLQVIYEYDEKSLRKDLSNWLERWMKQKFSLEEPMKFNDQAQVILDMVDSYGILTLDQIVKRFHNFAVETWCPIFAQSLLKILWPLMKDFVAYEPEDMEFHKLTFNFLDRCRKIQIYLDRTTATNEEITDLFR